MEKYRVKILLLVLLILCGTAQIADSKDEEMMSEKYLIILMSTKNYNEAVNFANLASRELGLKFNNTKIKYSKEKGIYFPEDIEDELYKGSYYPRRYSGEQISLENSGAYQGLKKNYIIVVMGVYDDLKNANKALHTIKQKYKDAYIKKTIMWMGCIH